MGQEQPVGRGGDGALVPFIPGSLAAARLFRLFRLFRRVPLFRLRNLLSLDGVRWTAFLTVMVVSSAARSSPRSSAAKTSAPGTESGGR